MLVLSRQRDETIMIGDDIEITIVDIRGDKVRLGITAPSTVPVHRKEVYEAIQRENREAAKVKMEDLPSMPGRPPGKGPPIGPRIVPVRPPQQGDARNGSAPTGQGQASPNPAPPTPPATPPASSPPSNRGNG